MRGRIRRWRLLILQDSPSRPLEVFKLPGVEGPQKCGQPRQAKQQRTGDEPGQSRHGNDTFFVRSLSALAVTANDETDMAIAANKGVTCPATASGTKTKL